MHKYFRSKKKIPAYIHIPKTGGTYLVQRETTGHPVLKPMKYFGHRCVVKSLPSATYPPQGYLSNYTVTKKEVEKYFVFSTVRNPFSFFVSYYYHAGGHNPKYRDVDHYDFQLCQKSFDYYLKAIANRANPWPSRKLIHTQLFCDDGDLMVDWINRNESLDEDLAHLAEYVGVEYQRRNPQRVGVPTDYRKFYSDDLVDLVNQTWGRELSLFGYDFEKSMPAESRLYRVISPNIKNTIKYYWASDEMLR